MGWGGSFFVLPPQGSAPWGGSKKLPPQGSAPWGGSFLQKFSHQGGNFPPEGGAAERKSMDLDCYGAARRRQKIFGTFLCPYTLFPSFSSLFVLRKCHFLTENECLGELYSQNFLDVPPMVGGQFSKLPPHGGGKVLKTSPPGVRSMGGKFSKTSPPGVRSMGGQFSQKSNFPPTMGGNLDPWSVPSPEAAYLACAGHR